MTLVAATKALDRVLLWNHYVVPQWIFTHQGAYARWDRFGRAGRCRNTASPHSPRIWWYDADKAARIAKRS